MLCMPNSIYAIYVFLVSTLAIFALRYLTVYWFSKNTQKFYVLRVFQARLMNRQYCIHSFISIQP